MVDPKWHMELLTSRAPYSGPEPNHSDDGSSRWANGFSHDGWRDIYKPYIAAYKAGTSSSTVNIDEIVYWYRPTPHDAPCSHDPWPSQVETWHLFTVNADAGVHVFNFTMGVDKQSLSVSRGGQQMLGGQSVKDITSLCQTYNFNAYVGKF
ncbi:hypothetical protein ACHAQJ_009507 [Trichoderma viride]